MPEPYPVDVGLIARAQLVADGSNVHDLNQVVTIYSAGLQLYNMHVARGSIPPHVASLAEKAKAAEADLRQFVSDKERQKMEEQIQVPSGPRPRLHYFERILAKAGGKSAQTQMHAQ